jgi:3-oxoacyl-[acyl-carrier-protein] synthase II
MQNPSPPARRVVITGIGAVTPCGNTATETWASLIEGRSGIGRITRFDATGCTAQIAGEVRNFDPARTLPGVLRPRGPASEPISQALTQKDVKKFGRFTHLGVGAAAEAYADSGLDAHRGELPPDRMGVNLGVGLGGLPEMEAMHDTWRTGGFRKISPFFIIQIAPNLLAGQVSLARAADGALRRACRPHDAAAPDWWTSRSERCRGRPGRRAQRSTLDRVLRDRQSSRPYRNQ